MIQVHPKHFTHHHAHRLFHLSLGLCFAFIVLAMLAGLVAVWWGAEAGTVTSSKNVKITAKVGGINAGPATPQGSGLVPTVETPTISITAEPAGQVPLESINLQENPALPNPGQATVAPAYVFSTATPVFSGETSVTGGLIFIAVHGPIPFNSTVVADSSGHWLWQSPYTLSSGAYYITATVYASQSFSRSASASTYFVVRIPAPPVPSGPEVPGSTPPSTGPGKPGAPTTGENLFGIFLEVLKDYKQVDVGSNVVAAVTLVNKSATKEIQGQVIHYTVKDWDGSVIMESDDTVSFSKITRYLKTFLTAPGTQPGVYRIIVSSTFQGVTSTASDNFVLTSPLPSATPGPSYTIWWGALAGILLLFLLLLLFAYYQVRMVSRHIKEHNEKYHSSETESAPSSL